MSKNGIPDPQFKVGDFIRGEEIDGVQIIQKVRWWGGVYNMWLCTTDTDQEWENYLKLATPVQIAKKRCDNESR